jgi:hypothetical protein
MKGAIDEGPYLDYRDRGRMVHREQIHPPQIGDGYLIE